MVVFAAICGACTDETTDPEGGGGSGMGGADGGAPEGGAPEGGGGAGPCDECDQLCVAHGCDAPTYSCEPSNGNCDGPPTGPACSCDGTVVEDDFGYCELAQQGLAEADASICQTGTFTCGTLQCTRHAEICVISIGGPKGAGESYECRPLADVKGFCSSIPDCGCMDLEPLGCGGTCDCTADADGQETVHIALP